MNNILSHAIQPPPEPFILLCRAFCLIPRQQLKARGVLTLAIRCQASSSLVCWAYTRLLVTELYNCSYTWISQRMNTDFSHTHLHA
jgi:hypothetical protein